MDTTQWLLLNRETRKQEHRSWKYDSESSVCAFTSVYTWRGGVGPLTTCNVKPLMYPSLLTVRFGTVWQNSITYPKSSKSGFNVQKHYSFYAFKRDKWILWREGDRTVFPKCNGPDNLSPRTSFRPSFRYNLVKISPQKSRWSAPAEMCQFDEASKT